VGQRGVSLSLVGREPDKNFNFCIRGEGKGGVKEVETKKGGSGKYSERSSEKK